MTLHTQPEAALHVGREKEGLQLRGVQGTPDRNGNGLFLTDKGKQQVGTASNCEKCNCKEVSVSACHVLHHASTLVVIGAAVVAVISRDIADELRLRTASYVS
jgi:hypothetical protein